VRVEAAHALGVARTDSARTALGCALWDVDRRVRAAAAEALGEFSNDDQAAGLLVRRFGTESSGDVRETAIESLAQVGGAKAVPTLAQLGDNELAPPEIRGAALLGVAEIDELDAPSLAIAAARATKFSARGTAPELRRRAIVALGKLSGRSDAACDALT